MNRQLVNAHCQEEEPGGNLSSGDVFPAAAGASLSIDSAWRSVSAVRLLPLCSLVSPRLPVPWREA